jgi:hypothetical protein
MAHTHQLEHLPGHAGARWLAPMAMAMIVVALIIVAMIMYPYVS